MKVTYKVYHQIDRYILSVWSSIATKRIHKGGSDLEIIARIKKCIGYVDAL